MFCKKLIFSLIFFLNFCDEQLSAQVETNNVYFNNKKTINTINENSSLNALGVIAVMFPLNPILLIENKKFYAGITKEFSFSFYPAGRLAAEYSLIFRKTDLNQLRFSYNYDIPIETSDYAAIYLSVGGGYFTDFKKYGFFPQASANLLLPASDNIAVNAYFKVRNTFVSQETGSDIFDVTFGLSTTFSF